MGYHVIFECTEAGEAGKSEEFERYEEVSAFLKTLDAKYDVVEVYETRLVKIVRG